MTAIILSFVNLLKLAMPFAFVLAIIWIRGNRRRDRWDWAGRRAPSSTDDSPPMTKQEQAALNDLVRIAERMEQRLVTLEKIIEVDDPHWKERV
jgi:phage shock protein B